MRPRIYTEIPADGEEWRFMRSAPSGIEPLPQNVSLPGGAEIVVFVPGTDVTAHRVRAAARRPAELTRLATFAIEDELAVPVESVHVAVAAEQDESGARQVYAVAHELMQNWIGQIEQAGLGAARIVPDLSLLPPSEHVEFARHTLLSVEGRPVALDRRWPEDVMHALVREAAGTEPVRQADSLTQLAHWAETAPRLTDLRQGTYARASESALSLRQFRLPAALAATLFVTWAAHSALSVRSMTQLTEALNAEAQARYTAAFPDRPVPSNPAAALRAAQTGHAQLPKADFQQTSAALYGAVADLPGTHLVSLRYDRGLGELRATLTYPSFGADLDLKQSVEATGLKVNLGDTRLEEGRVVGDLAIGGAS